MRVSLYDVEGGEADLFIDLVEDADAIILGSPTINGDAVKPIWDLISSFSKISVRGKLAGAFGSYGWSGEAVRMLEDRMRGLKMRLPVEGVRVKLIPSPDELELCRNFGLEIAKHLVGEATPRTIEMADLLRSKQQSEVDLDAINY